MYIRVVIMWMSSSDKTPCVVLAKYRMNMEHRYMYILIGL